MSTEYGIPVEFSRSANELESAVIDTASRLSRRVAMAAVSTGTCRWPEGSPRHGGGDSVYIVDTGRYPSDNQPYGW